MALATGVLLKPGKKRAAPEAGSSLPIIGHLHLLGGPKPTHIVLGDTVGKYGLISELRILMMELYKLWEQKRNGSNKVVVEMKRWFEDMTINVILKILVRKSIGYETSEEEEEHKQGSRQKLKLSLMEYVEMLGRFVVSDALPCLRWFDIGSHGKKMKRIAQELDIFANEWLREHKPILSLSGDP